MYGTAAGLGFAVGEAFVRELSLADVIPFRDADPFDVLWTTLLSGLSQGLFGAIIGLGFGAAALAGRLPLRLVFPILAAAGAIIVHWLYRLIAGTNTGTGGLVRTWITLLLPLFFVTAVLIADLLREREAIAAELTDERERGVVTEEELALLRNPIARRRFYATMLLRGDFDGWGVARALHNRQVQLALVRRRATVEGDSDRQAETLAEIERLRTSIAALKSEMARSLESRGLGASAR
jgi:hypothetical protein